MFSFLLCLDSDFEISEESSNGLLCLLKRKLEDLQLLQKKMLGCYTDNVFWDRHQTTFCLITFTMKKLRQ